jgi:hypothetical protein
MKGTAMTRTCTDRFCPWPACQDTHTGLTPVCCTEYGCTRTAWVTRAEADEMIDALGRWTCERPHSSRCDNCGTNNTATVPFSWPGRPDVWAYCLPCDAAARKAYR